MRRFAGLLVLLAASPGLRADPAETPFLVFREADPETAQRIKRDLIAEKSLGGRAPEMRRETREQIARIGPWCVPFLATALRKETPRVRLNVVLALAMIRDPRGLPALPRIGIFPELNVRTYVVAENRPGVWFFSLDAPSRLAVELGRRLFHLPYRRARASFSREPGDEGTIAAAWERIEPPGPARFRARYVRC